MRLFGYSIRAYTVYVRMNLSSVIFQETVDNIHERVLPMWPDGVVFQSYRDESNEYLIQFIGNPWTARSTLGLMAMKMILELFAVLGRQVCTFRVNQILQYRTSVHTGLHMHIRY